VGTTTTWLSVRPLMGTIRRALVRFRLRERKLPELKFPDNPVIKKTFIPLMYQGRKRNVV
jgi:hypothetical protein